MYHKIIHDVDEFAKLLKIYIIYEKLYYVNIV